MRDLYAAAKAYVGIGWWPFVKDIRSKRPPLGSHDYKDARLDPSPWQCNPHLNIALACGPSNIVVLDDDSDEPTALVALGQLLGCEALNTPIQITGGGGHHVFYRNPGEIHIGKLRLKELPGWEVLGESANVLLSPSLHPSGRRYRWLDAHSPWRVRPRTLPKPLIEMILEQSEAKRRELARYPSGHWQGTAPRSHYAEAMLEGCLAELPGTPERYRNDKLNKVSYRLGRAVGGGLLTAQQVEGKLLFVGEAMGLTPYEVQHTVQSGMWAGVKRPLYLAAR